MILALSKNVGTIFLVGLILVSALNAFRIGISGVANALAESEMDRWPKASRRIDTSSNRIKSYLDIGSQFYPDNPFLLASQGRLREYEALPSPSNPAVTKENLRSALCYYIQASKLQPASSISWAIVAVVKSQLGELDPEFDEALAQSVRLGPWEPLAQILVVRIGLRNWAQLSGQMRALIRDTAIRGMLSQALGQTNTMAGILEKQNFLPLVCPSLPASDKFSRFCNNT